MNLDMIIRFGKYKGRTIKWVMYNDRRYFNWAQENAPNMFEEYKPSSKPKSLEPEASGKPKLLDPDDEGEVRDSWTNPHLFYEIAQKMLREEEAKG